jgi:hypothetical protein
MTDFTELTLVEDTRWDMVSYKAYGSVDKISLIAEANPTIPLRDIVPAGTLLYIPIIEPTEAITDLLPPWKR